MSTDDESADPDLSRTDEEKLRALSQRESVSEETRRVAKELLERLQEGSL